MGRCEVVKKRGVSVILQAKQIAQWIGCSYSGEESVSSFFQDSRLVQKGGLFFAIKGNKVDGHAYLEEVARQGAFGAVVSSEYQGPDFGLTLFKVDNVLSALQTLARHVQKERSCKVVAVTGSVGKTTTKEFVATLLSYKYRVMKTPGNANSQVSLPLFLLNIEGDEEIFVLEMGMSEKGEIAKLVSIAPPDIALITKIALCHATYHPDGLEGIASAKGEILSSDRTRLAVLNHQVLPFASCHKPGCQELSYGPWGGGYDLEFRLINEKTFEMKWGQTIAECSVSFAAPHLIENVMGAIGVALDCGMTIEEIQQQLPQLSLYSKRFERIEKHQITMISDAYNASPLSVKAVLSHLPSPQPGGRRIAVLGSMRELGSYEEQSHREVGEWADRFVDHLLCLGPETVAMAQAFEKGGKPVEHFLDLGVLEKRLFEMLKPGDVVLIKGSNSLQMWRLAERF